MPRPTPVLAAALVLALPGAASAQDTPYPDTQRPHATLTLRAPGDVRVQELRARTEVRGRRLRVVASVAVHAPRARRMTLRIGTVRRTFRAQTAPEAVPGFVTTTVPLPRGNRTLRLRLTAGRAEAGELVLPPQAWAPPNADRSFGGGIANLAGVTVSELRFDAVGISDGAVRPTERFTATVTRPVTLAFGCPQPTGTVCHPWSAALAPGAARTVQRRPFKRSAEPAVGWSATVEGAPLFAAELPRPTR